jgi:hypothetical protein
MGVSFGRYQWAATFFPRVEVSSSSILMPRKPLKVLIIWVIGEGILLHKDGCIDGYIGKSSMTLGFNDKGENAIRLDIR